MELFKLTPPDENTIYCDISQLNKAFNIVLSIPEHRDRENIDYCIHNLKNNEPIELYGLDRHDEQFLMSLDTDVRDYLLLKLETFLQKHDTIKTYLETSLNDCINSQDLEDTHTQILSSYDEPHAFDDRTSLKYFLEDCKNITIPELETHLWNNHTLKSRSYRGWCASPSNSIEVLTHSIPELTRKVSIPLMLKELNIDVSLEDFNIMLLVFSHSGDDSLYFKETSINSLQDDLTLTYDYDGGILYYFEEEQITDAIKQLEKGTK